VTQTLKVVGECVELSARGERGLMGSS
jgi:hypothetical protein